MISSGWRESGAGCRALRLLTGRIPFSECRAGFRLAAAAEDAPLGVLLLAEVCQEFLPPGVLNVLTGLGEECGAPLANHPTVRKLSFTGSTEVGKLIMRAASDRIVPVSLELGGKSPSIVFQDANEDWVIDGIIAAIYCGQLETGSTKMS